MVAPKHIVIKHKGSPVPGSVGNPKVVHTRPTVPPVLRKRKSRGPAIAVGVICALVVLIGGWLLLNVYKQQQREVRIEELALQDIKMKTQALYGRLPDDLAKMNGYLQQVDQHVAGVGAIAGFVTNNATGGSVDAAGSVPPHHERLLEIARDVAANRDTLYVLQDQMMYRQSSLATKRDEVLRAQRRVVVAAVLAEIEQQFATIDEWLAEARGIVQQVEAGAAEAAGIKEKEIALREARAAADQRQREAEDLQRRTEDEVRQAAELVRQSKASIRRFAFRAALAPLENAQAAFTTTPGREALAIPIERLQRLQTLKRHLIEGLNANPYRWGWGMTTADSQDITGADETEVKITKGLVEWKDVPIPQLMKIIAYIGKTGRRLSSEQAEDRIATAILLEEFGLQAEACEQVNEAIAINRLMADDARRLLPDCK